MLQANPLIESFTHAAGNVGALVQPLPTLDAAVAYLKDRVRGPLLLPDFATGRRFDLAGRLRRAGLEVVTEAFRMRAPHAAAGLTGANFALADTGTLVLDSTAEDIRLATTLPETHFALLDPAKILPDGRAAVPHLRALHRREPRNFIAYVTGPSRTADIERVLTIGVHGPKELHILLLPGLSSDPQEM